MKRFTIVFLLIVLVGLSFTPARAVDGQQSSYYAASHFNDVGLVLPYKNMELFNSSMFDTASVGVFYMDGETFFTNYSGLVKVTGSCYQFNPLYDVEIYVNTNAGMFLVAYEAGKKFLDFEYVTASPWLQVGAVTYAQDYNLLKCALLFEVLE